jgi:ribonuclease BN (tRNA processing enzyme)
MGPEGLQSHYVALRQLWEHRVEPTDYELRVDEFSEGELEWGVFRIRAARTFHSMPNLAWRIDGPDDCGIIVTGDGEPTEELVRMGLSSAHLLISECSHPGDEIVPGHMNPGQAGELARRCRSTKLILSHLNPDVDPGLAELVARNFFGGEVIAAEDGMVIELGSRG